MEVLGSNISCGRRVFGLEMSFELCHTLMSIRGRSTSYLGVSRISMAQFLVLKLLFVKKKSAL
jgi:hypothetical protein